MLGRKIGSLFSIGKKSVHNFFMGSKTRGITDKMARLAEVAYEKDRPQTIDGFTLNPEFSDERIATYINPKNREVRVGLRGTANLEDVGTDITAVIGGARESNPYFSKAVATIDRIRQSNPDYKIQVAGHSLGATVGKSIAEKNPDVRVFGYNTGSALRDTFQKNPENFISIRQSGDVISALDPNTNITMTRANPLTAHGIKTFF